jgi:hypothetical protein
MPLKKSKSRKTISSNIRELVKAFVKKGKSKKKAIAMAVAASLKKAGKSRKKKKKS